MNERHDNDTVRWQGDEDAKVDYFKHMGSTVRSNE